MQNIYFVQICKFQVISQIRAYVKVRNILQNSALNIWLIAFPLKLHQICEHRYNNSLTITDIHLHWNNMGFNKEFPFVASPGAENKSHHWESSLAGNLNLLTETCAKGRQIVALYFELQPYENWMEQYTTRPHRNNIAIGM